MAKSQASFNKKEKEKKRLKKRLDKQQKKEERKSNPGGGGLDSMLAYVDENGNITDTPPDPAKRTKIKADDIEIGIPKKETDETSKIRTGKLDYFNDAKGFGFIIEQGSQMKYFAHISSFLEELHEGDIVTFEPERGVKGMNAVQIKKATDD